MRAIPFFDLGWLGDAPQVKLMSMYFETSGVMAGVSKFQPVEGPVEFGTTLQYQCITVSFKSRRSYTLIFLHAQPALCGGGFYLLA